MEPSAFIDKWRQSGASERANKDSFLRDLCDVLGVPHPDPATGDPERDRYTFERDAILIHGGERQTVGKIDLYKHGCFILEAKQGSERDSKKIGTARRDTPAWNIAMTDAFGQAVQYSQTIDSPPPFLVVTDIGYCFDLYACFDGSRRYLKFPDALSSRINIGGLTDPKNIETLRAVFTDPHTLDPSKRTAKVTRDIAGWLADLAKSLYEQGHDQETVAKFLMRCLFTMFAEDVDLLPKGIFADAVKNSWLENPDAFPGDIEDLWRRMNEGGQLFGQPKKIWRFNGGLFANPIALQLDRKQLYVLRAAAEANWSEVEPAIFGTLLERAFDPKERHRLGAHYTPRAYVERLVRPTIEEPLREELDGVRAEVVAMISDVDPENNRKAVAEARKIVYAFYDRLVKIRVLDPACGSGNFLFVALDLFKRIENEVIELLDSLGEDRARVTFARTLTDSMVTPKQFLGIEIKPWAKEITELVLWIGWLQWQIRTKGYKNDPPQPILRDYHNIECRDAVLAWDSVEPFIGENGEPVTRWDGETMRVSPVTGEEIPDESARIPVYRHLNSRKAEWPRADFIVGNPPFIGNWRMRTALGDGYVEALRKTYHSVPESVDLVMYWWEKAAELTRLGKSRRFGFITTNSFSQVFARRVAANRLNAEPPLSLTFAISDHPWVDSADGAAVRIAMTTGVSGHVAGTLGTVISEEPDTNGEMTVQLRWRRGIIHADLTLGANVSDALPLKANGRICSPGVKLHGAGFIVSSADITKLLGVTGSSQDLTIIREYRNGKDLTDKPRGVKVIDLFGLSLDTVRDRYPAIFQRIVETVKPERDQNKRAVYRDKWWIFGEPRAELRPALRGISRFISTVETAKHRFFVFLDASILPDNRLVNVASDDALLLGVLSSRAHVVWALAAGGTLEDRPVYTKSHCFDPFPFPAATEPQKQRIRDLGEQLDAHRKQQQALHPELTITSMYNVLEKLRSDEALTAKEKAIHEEGLVSVLRQIHDDLDAAVFDAYSWPHDLADEAILEKLVALNAERAEEEKRGIVRWLRPEFQNAAGVVAPAAEQSEMDLRDEAVALKTGPVTPWPKELPGQIAAVRDLVSADRMREGWSATETARAFRGARPRDVTPILDSLAAVGLLVAFDTAAGRHWRPSD